MALQKSFTTVHGFECPEAYHKIQFLRSRKDDEGVFKAMTAVATFKDAAARAAGNPPVMTRNFRFTYDIESADNLYVQGYAHLKTLDDFSGATDV